MDCLCDAQPSGRQVQVRLAHLPLPTHLVQIRIHLEATLKGAICSGQTVWEHGPSRWSADGQLIIWEWNFYECIWSCCATCIWGVVNSTGIRYVIDMSLLILE